jgi:hypothetical protein
MQINIGENIAADPGFPERTGIDLALKYIDAIYILRYKIVVI